MNTDIVRFELLEASSHLQELVARLTDEKIANDDSTALGIQIAHLMDHLCRAWNCKNLTTEEHGKLPQDEFERLSYTIPNFLGKRILGEFAFC